MNFMKMPDTNQNLSNTFEKRIMHRGIVVFTTILIDLTKPKIRFCTDSNHAGGVSEICDGEIVRQWSRLETRF